MAGVKMAWAEMAWAQMAWAKTAWAKMAWARMATENAEVRTSNHDIGAEQLVDHCFGFVAYIEQLFHNFSYDLFSSGALVEHAFFPPNPLFYLIVLPASLYNKLKTQKTINP